MTARLAKVIRAEPCCGLLILAAPVVGIVALGRWAASTGLFSHPAVLVGLAAGLVAILFAVARSRRRGALSQPLRTLRASGGGRAPAGFGLSNAATAIRGPEHDAKGPRHRPGATKLPGR